MDIYTIVNSRSRRQTGKRINHFEAQRRFPISVRHLRRLKLELAVTHEIFSQEQVWPDQCDYVIQLFDGIQRSTEQFLNFIHSKRGQELVAESYHYSILADACQLSDQVNRIRNLTQEFVATSEKSPRRKSKQRKIQSSLQKLDHRFQDLMKWVNAATADA